MPVLKLEVLNFLKLLQWCLFSFSAELKQFYNKLGENDWVVFLACILADAYYKGIFNLLSEDPMILLAFLNVEFKAIPRYEEI